MGKAGRLGPEVRIFPLNFPMIRSGQLRTAKTYNQFQVWCELSCMSSTSQNGGSPGGSPWLEYVISWGLQTYILLFGGRSFQSHPGFEPPVPKDLRNVEITNAADPGCGMSLGVCLKSLKTQHPISRWNRRSWQFVRLHHPSFRGPMGCIMTWPCFGRLVKRWSMIHWVLHATDCHDHTYL